MSIRIHIFLCVRLFFIFLGELPGLFDQVFQLFDGFVVMAAGFGHVAFAELDGEFVGTGVRRSGSPRIVPAGEEVLLPAGGARYEGRGLGAVQGS